MSLGRVEVVEIDRTLAPGHELEQGRSQLGALDLGRRRWIPHIVVELGVEAVTHTGGLRVRYEPRDRLERHGVVLTVRPARPARCLAAARLHLRLCNADTAVMRSSAPDPSVDAILEGLTPPRIHTQRNDVFLLLQPRIHDVDDIGDRQPRLGNIGRDDNLSPVIRRGVEDLTLFHVGQVAVERGREDLVDPGWELFVALFQALDQAVDLFLACDVGMQHALSVSARSWRCALGPALTWHKDEHVPGW